MENQQNPAASKWQAPVDGYRGPLLGRPAGTKIQMLPQHAHRSSAAHALVCVARPPQKSQRSLAVLRKRWETIEKTIGFPRSASKAFAGAPWCEWRCCRTLRCCDRLMTLDRITARQLSAAHFAACHRRTAHKALPFAGNRTMHFTTFPLK